MPRVRGLDQGMIIRHPLIMVRCDRCGRTRSPRQLCTERIDPLCVEAEVRRQLPQNRAQFLIKGKYAGGKEVGQRSLDTTQFLHVRDEPPALDGKDEILWHRGRPCLKAGAALQGIETAVDLNRIHSLGHVRQLLTLGQPGRIELASPGRICPT